MHSYKCDALTTQQWIAVELPFTAKTEISNIKDAELDVIFTNTASSLRLVMPAFWDGGTSWLVRFAPTVCGEWTYETLCRGAVDLELTGQTGTLTCTPYRGDLALYQHGFVKTESGVRHFVYHDGTPFFYLGDTHWAMLNEELDSPGKHAAGIQTDSHFRYIVDKRVEQGFTVYQSEPIGHRYNACDGITAEDIPGFQECDRYFQYIAEKGLVHANAQLIFPGSINENFFNDTFLYHVTRYWVARYAAYPVLWSLGQEVDRCFFGKCGMTVENNPYKRMCQFIYQLDPYRHPITAHQENAMLTGASGEASTFSSYAGETKQERKNHPSAFYGMPEHTWWGVQWRPEIDGQHNFSIPKDYWYTGEGKVTVNYETRYDYLYTKNYGARANGWISFLNGMFGYGYGAADIWCYLSTYSFDKPSSDGVDTVTPEEKAMPWGEAVLLPTGDQMTYMRQFFEQLEWWNLVPDFDEGNFFRKTEKDGCYSAAHMGNDVFVVYLYSKSASSAGILTGMDENALYTAQWFDPRTGSFALISNQLHPVNGEYDIPTKPVEDDMVLLVQKQ